MKFRETTQEDIDYVSNHSISRGIFKHQPEQTDYIYTLEHDDKPLGVGGFRLINQSTAWCWVDLTHQSGNHIISVYRVIKEWIDIFSEEHKLRRLQCYVEQDFEDARRMVQHLGFHKESIMKNFMGSKDADMYVRLI